LERRYESFAVNNNGKLISERTHVAKLLNTYFSAITEQLQCNFIPGTCKYTNSNQKLFASMFFTPSNIDGVTSLIKDLKNKKSSGSGGVLSFLINKMLYIYLIQPLTFLTNLTVSNGKFLENLKIANIKPLFKKGAAK